MVSPTVERTPRPSEGHPTRRRAQGRDRAADLVEWCGKRPRGEGTPGAMADTFRGSQVQA